jgi:hypothetical protein
LQVFLREHNRLCGELDVDPATKSKSPDEKYRIAKSTVIAKMQQITVNEFLPALGITKSALQNTKQKISSRESTVEFSIGYRLGHTLIPDQIGSFTVADMFDGQVCYYHASPVFSKIMACSLLACLLVHTCCKVLLVLVRHTYP